MVTILTVCNRVRTSPIPAVTIVVLVLSVRLGTVVFPPMLFNVLVAVVGSAQVGGTAGPPDRLPQSLSKSDAFVLTVPCVLVVLAVPSIVPLAPAVLVSALVAGVLLILIGPFLLLKMVIRVTTLLLAGPGRCMNRTRPPSFTVTMSWRLLMPWRLV